MTYIYKTKCNTWAVLGNDVFLWNPEKRLWESKRSLSNPEGIGVLKEHSVLVAKVREFKQ